MIKCKLKQGCELRNDEDYCVSTNQIQCIEVPKHYQCSEHSIKVLETKRYEIDRIDVLNLLKGVEGSNMPPAPMIKLIESGIATWNQTECAGWHFNENFLVNVDVSIGFATYKKIKRHYEEHVMLTNSKKT